MISDRQLLEAAARACGFEVSKIRQAERDAAGYRGEGLWIVGVSMCWNPLRDNDEAMQVAAQLRISLEWFGRRGIDEELQATFRAPVTGTPGCWHRLREIVTPRSVNNAMRRVIVRAAAAIDEKSKEV